MDELAEIARTALNRDALMLRALTQEFMHAHDVLARVAKPELSDPQALAFAASLVELLALRSNQNPPKWAIGIPAAPEPFYLLAYADKMPRLRQICYNESPEPLRKRGFYAPPNFLEFA